MTDFPNQVNVAQTPGLPGDWASKNPRHSFVAGPGGLVAGPNGVTVGRFAWATAPLDADGTPGTVSNSGYGLPSGFVHREQQALITTYLAASGSLIPAGMPVTLTTSADFWVKNDGATEAQFGQKAYVNFADGKVTFAATGAPTSGGSGSASTIAAGTSSMTGSIAGNVLTITAVSSGTLYPGATISGTGVATGTQVVSQLTGTAGGIGTYLLNTGEQTVSSTTISSTYGLLTIGGTVTGTSFAVGQSVTGSGVSASTFITALGTGTGGAGTYIVNNTQTVGSTAITSQTNIETKYYARSTGLVGESVKVSPTPLS